CPARALALRGSLRSPLRVTVRHGPRLVFLQLRDRSGEIRAGQRRDASAELLAQRARPDLGDRARRQLAELERPVGHPDQPVHRETEMTQHVPDLAVLALTHGEGEPNIGALFTIE